MIPSAEHDNHKQRKLLQSIKQHHTHQAGHRDYATDWNITRFDKKKEDSTVL